MGCCSTRKELVINDYDNRKSTDQELLHERKSEIQNTIFNSNRTEELKLIELKIFFLSKLINVSNVCILSKHDDKHKITLVNDIMSEYYFIDDGVIFSEEIYKFGSSTNNYNKTLIDTYLNLTKKRYIIFDLNINYDCGEPSEHLIDTIKKNTNMLIIFITDNITIFEKVKKYFDYVFMLESVQKNILFRKSATMNSLQQLYNVYSNHIILTYDQYEKMLIHYKNIVIDNKNTSNSIRNIVYKYIVPTEEKLEYYDLSEFNITSLKETYYPKILIIGGYDNLFISTIIDNIANRYKTITSGILMHNELINIPSKKLKTYDNLDEKILDKLSLNKKKKLLILNKVIKQTNKNNSQIADIIFNAQNYNIFLIVRILHNVILRQCMINSFDLIFIFNGGLSIIINRLYEYYANIFPSKNTFMNTLEKYTKGEGCIIINNKLSKEKDIKNCVFWLNEHTLSN
jgi:hypothetical protein